MSSNKNLSTKLPKTARKLTGRKSITRSPPTPENPQLPPFESYTTFRQIFPEGNQPPDHSLQPGQMSSRQFRSTNPSLFQQQSSQQTQHQQAISKSQPILQQNQQQPPVNIHPLPPLPPPIPIFPPYDPQSQNVHVVIPAEEHVEAQVDSPPPPPLPIFAPLVLERQNVHVTIPTEEQTTAQALLQQYQQQELQPQAEAEEAPPPPIIVISDPEQRDESRIFASKSTVDLAFPHRLSSAFWPIPYDQNQPFVGIEGSTFKYSGIIYHTESTLTSKMTLLPEHHLAAFKIAFLNYNDMYASAIPGTVIQIVPDIYMKSHKDLSIIIEFKPKGEIKDGTPMHLMAPWTEDCASFGIKFPTLPESVENYAIFGLRVEYFDASGSQYQLIPRNDHRYLGTKRTENNHYQIPLLCPAAKLNTVAKSTENVLVLLVEFTFSGKPKCFTSQRTKMLHEETVPMPIHNDLSKALQHVLETVLLPTFGEIKDTNADFLIQKRHGIQLLAHKAILAARSPHLADLLLGNPKSAKLVLDLSEFHPAAVDLFLTFIYTDVHPFVMALPNLPSHTWLQMAQNMYQAKIGNNNPDATVSNNPNGINTPLLCREEELNINLDLLKIAKRFRISKLQHIVEISIAKMMHHDQLESVWKVAKNRSQSLKKECWRRLRQMRMSTPKHQLHIKPPVAIHQCAQLIASNDELYYRVGHKIKIDEKDASINLTYGQCSTEPCSSTASFFRKGLMDQGESPAKIPSLEKRNQDEYL